MMVQEIIAVKGESALLKFRSSPVKREHVPCSFASSSQHLIHRPVKQQWGFLRMCTICYDFCKTGKAVQV